MRITPKRAKKIFLKAEEGGPLKPFKRVRIFREDVIEDALLKVGRSAMKENPCPVVVVLLTNDGEEAEVYCIKDDKDFLKILVWTYPLDVLTDKLQKVNRLLQLFKEGGVEVYSPDPEIYDYYAIVRGGV